MHHKPFAKKRHQFRPRRKPPPIKAGADSALKRVFAAIGVPDAKPFQPDPFQINALDAVGSADCLVTVPTGAGKTWIAIQAIARIKKGGGRAWYASPLKALSNSKFAEFSQIFGAPDVGILTGDRKERPEAPIIVGTTEILRNQLYDAMHQGSDLGTDFVVLDEAHFLNDAERGVVWEEIMIYLPPRIPLLLLSATVGNADQIAGWLTSIRVRKCVVVSESERPVPLAPLFLHPSGTLLPLLSPKAAAAKPRLSRKVRHYLSGQSPPYFSRPGRLPPFGEILRVLGKYRLLPAIFFLKSRADCDKALELCQDKQDLGSERRDRLSRRIQDLVERSPHVANHRHRWHLEHLAVGAHHSGQLPAWKLALETLMSEGALDAVFATSTVAAGVNFPARTVVFLNSDRYNGREFLPLESTEFHQMTGRAGRRGMDNIGFAAIMPGKFMDVRLIAQLIASPPGAVKSQIRINFSMVLNLLLSHSPAQIEDLLKKSFAAYLMGVKRRRRADRRPSTSAHRRLWNDFSRHLAFLKETGFADSDDRLTTDGSWASQLRIDQPLIIAEGLRGGLFPADDPALLAALMAPFVWERECDDRGAAERTAKRLSTAFRKVKNGLEPFAKRLIERHFEVRPLYFRPALTLYAWASMRPWDEVVAMSEIEEGNLAMLILRTADNLRHIRTLTEFFPAVAQSAAKAMESIMRDPVLTEYGR